MHPGCSLATSSYRIVEVRGLALYWGWPGFGGWPCRPDSFMHQGAEARDACTVWWCSPGLKDPPSMIAKETSPAGIQPNCVLEGLVASSERTCPTNGFHRHRQQASIKNVAQMVSLEYDRSYQHHLDRLNDTMVQNTHNTDLNYITMSTCIGFGTIARSLARRCSAPAFFSAGGSVFGHGCAAMMKELCLVRGGRNPEIWAD